MRIISRSCLVICVIFIFFNITGCATIKSEYDTEEIISKEVFSNAFYKVYALDNVLYIKYKSLWPRRKHTEHAVYNSNTGVLAVFNPLTSSFIHERNIELYKVTNTEARNILNDLINNKKHNDKLQELFDHEPSQFRYISLYDGNMITKRINESMNDFTKIKNAGLKFNFYNSYYSKRLAFKASDNELIYQFSKFPDIYDYIKQLKVISNPRFINKSGLSVNNDSINMFIKYDSTLDESTGKYKLKLNTLFKNDNYRYHVEPNEFLVDYNDKGVVINPNVTIEGVKISNYTTNIRAENNDLELNLIKIKTEPSLSNKPLTTFYFDIKNRSSSLVKINYITIFFRGVSFSSESNIKIPPMSILSDQILTTASDDANIISFVTLDYIKNSSESIGISADYTILNTNKSLIKTKVKQISEML